MKHENQLKRLENGYISPNFQHFWLKSQVNYKFWVYDGHQVVLEIKFGPETCITYGQKNDH